MQTLSGALGLTGITCRSYVGMNPIFSSVRRLSSPGIPSSLPQLGTDVAPKNLTPREMVGFLDQHIIGQMAAKRAVAIAVRQRWRRKRIADVELREDVMPKNLLLIGPTGVGKTEIARKLARLVDAPFIKVEATKFTEVGFQGRDVDQIIRDLTEIAVKNEKTRFEREVRAELEPEVCEIILDHLMAKEADSESRDAWRKLLISGELDEHLVSFSNLPPPPERESEDVNPSSRRSDSSGQTMVFRMKGGQVASTSVEETIKVSDARARILAAEVNKRAQAVDLVGRAVGAVEEDGIVVIDEIDKIVAKQGRSNNSDASDEGVQRDLLPIVEGTVVSTKFGNVRTDHILFIGSGAFAAVKPSDMISELQGRFPVRVELQALGRSELGRILTEPRHNLIRQQKALFGAEGVSLEVDDQAVEAIADVAYELNCHHENIGARRLGHIVEKLTEEHSFDVPDMPTGSSVRISVEDVKKLAKDLLKKADLKKFIL